MFGVLYLPRITSGCFAILPARIPIDMYILILSLHSSIDRNCRTCVILLRLVVVIAVSVYVCVCMCVFCSIDVIRHFNWVQSNCACEKKENSNVKRPRSYMKRNEVQEKKLHTTEWGKCREQYTRNTS